MLFSSDKRIPVTLKIFFLLLAGIAFSGCIRSLDADGNLGDTSEKGYESSRASDREWK